MIRSFVVLFAASAALFAEVKVIEEIAVKVNGDIITRGDIIEKQRLLRQEIQQQEKLSGPALDAAVEQQAKDMIRGMIDERLLVHKAKELDIKVDTDINRRISEYQVMSGLADPDKFHEWVREQTGITFEDFKQKITDQALAQRLVGSEVSSHIVVPEEDARKYYAEHMKDFVRKDEVYLSQLIIYTQGKTPEQAAAAEKKAQQLVLRARAGEKFSELVIANSEDLETSRAGGQLPPTERGIMQKEIEAIVFDPKNPKGFVTNPIKINGGFVILRIDDRTEAGQASYDEAKEQIQEFLARPKIDPKYREYLNKLRQEAFLEIKEGYVDTGAVPGKDTRWHEVVGLKPETTTKEEVAAHRKRKKFMGVVPHGTVAPGTREVSGGSNRPFNPGPDTSKTAEAAAPEPAAEALAPAVAPAAAQEAAPPTLSPANAPANAPVTMTPPAGTENTAPAPAAAAPSRPAVPAGPPPPTPPIIKQ